MAVACGALALDGCSTSSNGTTPTDGGADGGSNTIVIGVSLSLTGDLSAVGSPLQSAIKVAESQINSMGGVQGKNISFKIVDDASSPEQAKKVVQDFINQGVVAVLGPIASSQVKAVNDLLYQAKIIELSPTATSPQLSGCMAGKMAPDCAQPLIDRYFFRTVPPDDFQGKAVVKFALAGPTGGMPCKKIAVVHNDDAYGNPMAVVIAQEIKKAGGTVAVDIKIPADVKSSYMTEVQSILTAKPECQALVVFDPAGDQFMKDLKAGIAANPMALPATYFVIGTDGVYTSDFIKNGRMNAADPMSPTIVEGSFGTNPDTNPPTAEYNYFKNLYTLQFPLPAGQTDLDPYTANVYDAAILIALALQATGNTTDRVKLRDNLVAVSKPGGKVFKPDTLSGALAAISAGSDIDYKGASGEVDLDEAGNCLSGFIIWTVKNGAFVVDRRYTATDLQ